MAHDGVRLSTLRRYLLKLRAAYARFRPSEPNPFVLPNSELTLAAGSDTSEARANLRALRSLLAKPASASADPEALRAFLFLLYSCAPSFSLAVSLLRSDLDHYLYCTPAADIIRSASGPANRKYVFPLGQGRQRPPRLAADLAARIARLLTAAGLHFAAGFTPDSITALWIEAAISASVPLDCIAAIIPRIPPSHSYLALIPPAPLCTEDRQEIISHTAETLSGSRLNWYVARLNPSVTGDQFIDSVAENTPAISALTTFYYPLRTVAKKVDKKITTHTEPYLRDIIFLRTPANAVNELFHRNRQMARGYRSSSALSSPYAVIPPAEMNRFQRRIGLLTPDMQVELLTAPMLQIGRRVRVNGGIMDGYEGIIYDITPDRKAFVMHLTTGCALKWTARLTDFNLTPLD